MQVVDRDKVLMKRLKSLCAVFLIVTDRMISEEILVRYNEPEY